MKKMLFLCVACIVFLNIEARKVLAGSPIDLGELDFIDSKDNGNDVFVSYNNGTFELSGDDWNKIKNLKQDNHNQKFYIKAGEGNTIYPYNNDQSFEISNLTASRKEL